MTSGPSRQAARTSVEEGSSNFARSAIVDALLLALLALAVTWPLPTLADAVPGVNAGDNVTFVWNQNGVRYVVVDLNRAPAPLIALVDALPATLLAEEEGRRLYLTPRRDGTGAPPGR